MPPLPPDAFIPPHPDLSPVDGEELHVRPFLTPSYAAAGRSRAARAAGASAGRFGMPRVAGPLLSSRAVRSAIGNVVLVLALAATLCVAFGWRPVAILGGCLVAFGVLAGVLHAWVERAPRP